MNFDQFEPAGNSNSVEISKELSKAIKSLSELADVLLDEDGNLVDLSDKEGRSELIERLKLLNHKISSLPPVQIADESMRQYKDLISLQKSNLEEASKYQYMRTKELKEAQEPFTNAVKWFKSLAWTVGIGVTILVGTLYLCLPTYKSKVEFYQLSNENKKLKKNVEYYVKANEKHKAMLVYIRDSTAYKTMTWKQVMKHFPNYFSE